MARATVIPARREERSQVRLMGTLKYLKQELECRVVNLSREGIGLRLAERTPISIGIPVTFTSPELGYLHGVVVRIGHDGVVGLRLKHTTSTLAQVSSYFRFFHQDYTPRLQQ